MPILPHPLDPPLVKASALGMSGRPAARLITLAWEPAWEAAENPIGPAGGR